MITTFFTRPNHDFTRLGRVDGWLGRTLQHLSNLKGQGVKMAEMLVINSPGSSVLGSGKMYSNLGHIWYEY